MAAPAREEFKRDFAKNTPLTGGRALRVEHQFGRVSVRTHAGSEVQVRATIRCSAPTADQARRGADDVQIAVEDGMVRTTYPRNWPRNVSYSTDLDITMPQTAPLSLSNRFGATEVFSLHAAATITSGNGSVTLLAGRGRHRIENSFGPVEVRGNEGDVTIHNGNGAVTAIDINGAVEVSNRFGNIRAVNARGLTVRSNNAHVEAENIGGPVNITNTFGRVTVTDGKGDAIVQNQNGEIVVNGVNGLADLHTTFAGVTVSRVGKGLTVRAQNSNVRGDTIGESATVETTFGSVDLRNVRGGARVSAGNSSIKLTSIGGNIYAKSSFNGITIADAAGPVTVDNQNGSVTVEAKAGGGCKPVALRTTFAPIRVTIPRGSGYNLTARTTFGRIHVDPAVQVLVSGDLSQGSLTGKIGAGGCELQLTGQNGNVDILSR
jgi:hypothetical protein